MVTLSFNFSGIFLPQKNGYICLILRTNFMYHGNYGVSFLNSLNVF